MNIYRGSYFTSNLLFAESTNEDTCHLYCTLLFLKLYFCPNQKKKKVFMLTDSGDPSQPHRVTTRLCYILHTAMSHRNYRGKSHYSEWTSVFDSHYSVLSAGDSFHSDNIIYMPFIFFCFSFSSLPVLLPEHHDIKDIFMLSLTVIMNFHPLL